MSTTIKIVLRKKIRSDGNYPLCLRVTENRESKFIRLNIVCGENDFVNNELTKNCLNYKTKNKRILAYRSKADEVLEMLLKEKPEFTLSDFERSFLGQEESKEGKGHTVFEFFEEVIDENKRVGKLGNASAYDETKQSLFKFAKKDVSFKELTPTFLIKYEIFMRERGNEEGGIAFRMRELRALYNKAIDRGIASLEHYPFKIYKISKLKGKKLKRALPIESWNKFKSLDVKKYPHLLNSYNYFVFSFYIRGINFVDIMSLTWSSIHDNKITYTRSKTKGKFVIEILPVAQNILDYYKDQNRPTNYVFPILLANGLTNQEIYNRKKNALRKLNKDVKKIAEIVGIDLPLTSYVARHTYATLLKFCGTSTDKISQSLGHSDVKVTQTYLSEFENDDLDKANQALLDL